ncbi:hypothetical protein FB382_003066 [Nocardioides ginsengisegetis]|uniref:NERD domain-containing protein n=1 Tax=Nocardioides ginsengisegetis TaxID=661491 RepID=A0A7W3J1V6_9ACTN|nr:nuclease-related domain-containing protein [Nocardioides ginsengisegetis]MBA8804775.1 hypothetical protein [Nocardioides ginsengisegetis]
MAGESARESARRQREKAERLQRSAELWERGADGEAATAAALSALPSQDWTVFHDIRWPGRQFANIDHVVVGPAGVFVIDSKNWTGRIQVRDNVLSQNGRRREEAVVGVAEAGLAIARLCPRVVPQHVFSVLSFVRDEPVTGWARDVMVCSTANIAEMLSTRPAVLPPDVRQEACLWLDAQVHPATGPRQISSQRRAVPRPSPRSPSTRARSRRRSSGGGELAKAIVVLVVVGAVAFVPGVSNALSNGIANLLTSHVAPQPTPTPSPHTKHVKKLDTKHPKPTGR